VTDFLFPSPQNTKTWRFKLILNSFSRKQEEFSNGMDSNIQGVIESCTDIVTASYWLHVELGKKYLKNSVKK
jgi:hypothetical protein